MPTKYSGKFLTERHLLKFWSRVQVGGQDSCWPWTAGENGLGYGQMRVNTVLHTTHRLAYQDCVGPIPKGMVVRHKCDNPLCCNPHHLILGTQKDNMHDAIERGRHDMGRSKARKWLRIAAEVKAKRESES